MSQRAVQQPGKMEFITLMAAMTCFDAFAIDAMIPALEQISRDLNVINENHRQYVVTSIFLGFSVGVLFYGFVADAIGRRKPVIAGFFIFLAGSLICLTATSFNMLMIGRVLQGVGAAGPYVLSLTIVRDNYSGSKMAQTMSFIMMIFITVPIVAPLIGQGILLASNWRGIFAVMGIFGVLVLLWFGLRQPETLNPENRKDFRLTQILQQMKEILLHRQSLKYLIALGMMFGAFVAYLSTGQQIYQNIYGLGHSFPIIFASISAVMGLSSYLNSRWTEKFALTKLVHFALLVIFTVSLLLLISGFITEKHPPLLLFMFYMSTVFFCYGLLFGNITTLALEPMGHIAGSASSIVTSISTLLSIILATLIGSRLENTVYPIVAGFGLLALVVMILNSNLISGDKTSAESKKPV